MKHSDVMAVMTTAILFTAFGECSTANHQRLAAQEDLPHAVRPATKAAMSRHGEHASALTVSIALGSYDQTLEHVDALLSEPRPATPPPGDTSTLNELLPARYFELDDRFRSALQRLKRAAQDHDDDRSIAELGSVVRACRACHRAFGEIKVGAPRSFPEPRK